MPVKHKNVEIKTPAVIALPDESAKPMPPKIAPTPKELAAKLRTAFMNSVEHQVDTMDPVAVTRALVTDLNTQKKVVAARLLGFEHDWGRWEVKSKSVMDELVNDECRAIAKTWVNEILAEFLSEAKKEEFKKNYKKALADRIKYMLNESTEAYTSAKHISAALLEEAENEVREELGISPEAIARAKAKR